MIERLSWQDRTVLATDRGRPPMQVAALLELDPPELDPSQELHRGRRPTPAELCSVLESRLPRVPRLRQRLRYPPLGGGGPYWSDDSDFALSQHVVCVPVTGDRASALLQAGRLVCEPLDRHRALWRAALLVTGEGRVSALVLVLHHVLGDGATGLAALAALTDGGHDIASGAAAFPRPAPGGRALLEDRLRTLGRRLVSTPQRLVTGVAGLSELGTGLPHLAPRISLVRPTGPHRRVAVIDLPLPEVVALAHAAGGTVNDVLVALVSGAVLRILRERGEWPPRLAFSVPVAERSAAAVTTAGNHTGVRAIEVPAIADDAARLRYLVRLGRCRRPVPRGSSSVPLGLTFRALARAGLFSWFIDHQRLVHSFVSNLRGPTHVLKLGGTPVRAITALSATPGNVGVSFTALSYAGQLSVAAVSDPTIVHPETIGRAVNDVWTRLHDPTRGS